MGNTTTTTTNYWQKTLSEKEVAPWWWWFQSHVQDQSPLQTPNMKDKTRCTRKDKTKMMMKLLKSNRDLQGRVHHRDDDDDDLSPTRSLSLSIQKEALVLNQEDEFQDELP